jgi:hypothetical protein
MKWICLRLIGIGVIALFSWLLIKRNQEFDAPMLGLLTLGLLFLGISLLQPDLIKYGTWN